MNSAKTSQLFKDYQAVRQQTKVLCQPLTIEDYVVQSMEDVSPPKWHLAHTAWFFEAFILCEYLPKYSVFDPSFHYKFNSYYYGMGQPFSRAQRGLLSRPTVETIYAYREHVDNYVYELLDRVTPAQFQALASLIELGINHEQQHQELLLMDIKHNFAMDPTFPSYKKTPIQQSQPPNEHARPDDFIYVAETIATIGSEGKTFYYDNEAPPHKKMLAPYCISPNLITNAQYCEFIDSGGYQQPRWWLSDGWDRVQKHHWQAPLYWCKLDNDWYIFTLSGLTKLNPHEPVSHVSFFEADAYARWRDCRLPLEEEWEYFVTHSNLTMKEGNYMENNLYHPRSPMATSTQTPQQFFGDVWEWTASAYMPYPGFLPLPGLLGEYNGKFMNNQMVLRGGCCATPSAHIRASYRNFFQSDKRWQFSGIRLAKNT